MQEKGALLSISCVLVTLYYIISLTCLKGIDVEKGKRREKEGGKEEGRRECACVCDVCVCVRVCVCVCEKERERERERETDSCWLAEGNEQGGTPHLPDLRELQGQ